MNNENLIQQSQNKLLPFFDHNLGTYWVEDQRGDFIRIKESDLKLRLRKAGYSPKQPDGKPLSPLDEKILQIQDTLSVSYAAPLAGYIKGLHRISGQRILVTTSPVLIEPHAGDWSVLAKVLENLFGDQVIFFYGWMKHAIECLRSGKRAPGQALVIAGEHASGKSLVQNIVTLLLGGRSEKPYRYMAGETTFNSELFRAEHLMIEDEPASRDLRTRKRLGAQIKVMLVNETQSCHAKNRQAVNLTPFWRLTISLNIEPENLMILPPLDNSLEDKIILLRGAKHKMPMPTASPKERELFWKKIESELPAFVDFLLSWQIPENLKSERFGIVHYHDPELRKAIDTLAPEMRLLELIDSAVFILRETPFVGTAAQLEHELETGGKQREARALLDFPTAAGTYLGRLATSQPKRVQKQQTAHGTIWTIQLPAAD